MKFKILILGVLSLVLTSACERDGQDLIEDPYLESYADVEECLKFTPLKGNQPGPTQSCIHYSYDGDSTLEITHYNSGFNCCPEEVLTSFSLRDDTIFIVEDDAKELCRCNCLFNVEMTIHNLPPGKYVLKIEEPYVDQKDQIFIIDLDLEDLPMDQVCKYRDFYPWGDF
jgi:hypothetical protein